MDLPDKPACELSKRDKIFDVRREFRILLSPEPRKKKLKGTFPYSLIGMKRLVYYSSGEI